MQTTEDQIKYITASKLYDYTQCPHRIWKDIYGNPEERGEENEFLKLLWSRGVQHEERVIRKMGEYIDLSSGRSVEDRFNRTVEAMNNGADLIYQGVLKHKNLLGIPDLLKKMPDGSYIPIDIKSGMAIEGVDEENNKEGKYKKHYAVQLCLYVELLKILGFANKNKGIIIDIHGDEVEYNLDEKMGPRSKLTWWEFYEDAKNKAELLLYNKIQNKPALAGICKLCHWYDSCKKWVEKNNDLTAIFYLGRSKRDVINDDLQISKVKDFSNLDLKEAMKEKKENKDFLKGVGEKTLKKLITRANILEEKKEPVIYKKIDFPEVSYELFFDIEDDPTQEFVYLHGVYERKGNKSRFISFIAEDNTKEAEKEAWFKFWKYIKSLPQDDFAVYYYSSHEKVVYRRLQKQYPEIISEIELENFFENPNVIDLYKIVFQNTDWPISSYSLKDIATYLGFKWRDKTPSGVLSIKWYNDYLEKKDKDILKRLLSYNEDDCKATMALKDAIAEMSNRL